MYYNYTDEQKYFLSVTDAMLKDDFSVEEIVEFWNCEDQDQVDGILGSLMLTESVDYSNPDLALVCEKFGMGWLSRNAGRLWKRLRGINPKTGNPKITGSKPPSKVKQATDKVRQGAGAVVDKTKKALDKLPPGAKGGLAVAGTGLALIGGKDLLDYGKDAVDYVTGGGNEPTTTTTTTPTQQSSSTTPTKTTVTPYKSKSSGTSLLVPSKGPKWWQTYEKAARPYTSSRRYYQNIRA